jgi:DNA-binding MarR family transcriptional regulator
MATPEARIGYIVKRLEVAIHARLDLIAREHEITTMQYVALSVLSNNPGISSAQLAVRSFVTPQSANQMVTALERGGFISRRPDELNRRILRISLTEKGRNMLAEWDEVVDLFERAMLSDLSDEKQAEMRRLMLSCIESLAEYALKEDADR